MRKTIRWRKLKQLGTVWRAALHALTAAVVAAALAVMLEVAVFRISGTSMEPTLADGQIVVAVKTRQLGPGDLCVFSFGNRVLVKRVIAAGGSWVDLDDLGTVSINGTALEEPYLRVKSLGKCTIELPYQVPEGQAFVMGDARAVSIDSRTEWIGCVDKEQVLGKVVFRLWPLETAGKIN